MLLRRSSIAPAHVTERIWADLQADVRRYPDLEITPSNWRAYLSAHAHAGRMHQAMSVFEQMKSRGVQISIVCYVGLP